MSKNRNLHKAKDAKKDEFYTQYEDIQNELNHYEQHFKGKTVFCNCDDPFESNFCKFFLRNFNYLGLNRLICTSYSTSPVIGQQLTLFDWMDEPAVQGNGYVMDIREVPMSNGRGVSDADIDALLKSKKRGVKKLKGDGDFRSEECIEYLKQADIVVDIIETANPVLTVAPIEEETEMLGATDKITALYCRLSVEDMKEGKNGEKTDESNSIQTQKMILLQYAKQNHFPNPTFFVDDGYSGVDFDNRPGFQQMLTEVKTGRVGTIITKDLSRLGRNSAMTSLYINIVFPKSGVRYIAINDHFDSIDMNSTECDMAGIKNWFNEFFAKDTSRKIRAVQKAKGERGVPLTTNVPYGYIKDKSDTRLSKSSMV